MDHQTALHRPAVNAAFGKHLLFFPSRKIHGQVVCHSTLEADYCIHLEYDPAVVRYCSQPGELELRIDGRLHRYHPDFLVETLEEHYYTEVKVDFSQVSTLWKAKLRAAQQLLSETNSYLARADLASIRPPSRLRNLKFLYFHSFNVSADEYGGCLRLLPTLSYPVTLRELLAHPSEVRERAFYKALFDRQLSFDLNQRLTINTPIMGGGHAHQRT
ncbi:MULTISPECIES: hypothetical protein [Pseudomonas]|uniref:TnsA endonuclease N-terminal domain-containing protein n=1 Tax=Pseudomonas wuhanensis TaxID=2954098 RepID=A0ABY9GLJ4_9PSED|nr:MULTISPECIES: hypothetical protein [unclassified Pseudomonas]WLI10801.1 hypothetical protein PSH65_21870 [Pseudomonas sp. FP603]WLI16623.1 hypothetical protein PSH88_20500 [Pseudomonas sp. FP607]